MVITRGKKDYLIDWQGEGFATSIIALRNLIANMLVDFKIENDKNTVLRKYKVVVNDISDMRDELVEEIKKIP